MLEYDRTDIFKGRYLSKYVWRREAKNYRVHERIDERLQQSLI